MEVFGPPTALIFPKWNFDKSKYFLVRNTSFHNAKEETGIAETKSLDETWTWLLLLPVTVLTRLITIVSRKIKLDKKFKFQKGS